MLLLLSTYCSGLLECCAGPHLCLVLVPALEAPEAVREGHVGLEEVGVVGQAADVTGLRVAGGARGGGWGVGGVKREGGTCRLLIQKHSRYMRALLLAVVLAVLQ
jgi:hypothetical protein